MAEAVVSSVGQTIANLLIDEAKFLWGVEGKVEDLYRELRLIRCLLRDADTRGEHNQAVGECVAQLRDVAYDAEDVIERYTLRVELKKGQYITRACACFLANSTCLQVHAVGTEIEGLKSRISNLRMSMLAFGAQPANKDELKRTKASMLKRYYDHYEEDFIGRKHSVEALVKELSNGGETHRVICIWGMGGLGKTSLAKKVVAHDKVKNNFVNLAWVCISQEYCVKDILEKIFLELKPNQRDDELKKMNEVQLSTAVCDTLKKKKCLVVLDDIWTNEAWDSLRLAFPIKETRSKLLITTRNREVAEHIDSEGLIYKLQCLSNQESWDLLKKKAFPRTKGLVVEISSDGPGVGQGTATGEVVEGIARQLEIEEQLPVITQDMKRIRDELLKKCEGLPLAIIVLGGLLAVNEWKKVHEKINLHLGEKSDVFKMLALSYDDLPWHLKPCFLYLGSFSEDAKIPAMQVLRMWIAEGFVSLDENEEGETPVEDIAEQYLVELINRGMVQVQFNLSGKIKTCYLHDLMRDLCLTKARQERFLSILNIQQDYETKDCSPSMATKVKSTYKTRRLSLNMSAKGNMILRAKQIGRTMPNLRTLTSSGFDVNMWKQLPYVFINCKFLRVLKLERVYNMTGNLPKSVGDLVHLKFLSLAKCWFKGLPQSLGNLINMEFLDIHMDPFIGVIVPNVLWKMRKLRYLRLPTCFVIKKRFCGAQRKLRLNTLNSLRILKNLSLNMCDVNSLSKLTNLQKLTMIGRCDSSNTMVPSYVEFNSGDFPVISHIPGSSPLSEGELNMTLSWCPNCELFLCGKIEKLPKYESLPQQLSKLVLYKTQLEEDPMKILEKLKHLIVLMLGYDAFLGKKMICSAGGFSQLKHLVLRGLKDLEEWRVDEGAMPQLSRLAISSCPKLTVPGGVPHPHDDFEDLARLLRKVG